MEEATFLTKFATEVNLIHRSETFRASKIMLDRALGNPKIKMRMNTVVEEVVGSSESGVTGLKLRDVKSNSTSAKRPFARRRVRNSFCNSVRPRRNSIKS